MLRVLSVSLFFEQRVTDSRLLHESKANGFILNSVSVSIVTLLKFLKCIHANFPSTLTFNFFPSVVVIVLGIYKFCLSSIGNKIAFLFLSNVYLNLVLVLDIVNLELAPDGSMCTSSFLFI